MRWIQKFRLSVWIEFRSSWKRFGSHFAFIYYQSQFIVTGFHSIYMSFLALRARNVSDGQIEFAIYICRRARFTVPFLIVFPAFTSRKRQWRPMFCIANFIMNLTDSIQIKKTITTEATERTEKKISVPSVFSVVVFVLDKRAKPKHRQGIRNKIDWTNNPLACASG